MPSDIQEATKIKESEHVANALNDLFLTLIENLNLWHVEKEEAKSFLKESFPGNFPAWDKVHNEFPWKTAHLIWITH